MKTSPFKRLRGTREAFYAILGVQSKIINYKPPYT